MAKINVVGEAVVVTSAVKFEDFEKVSKYAPEALTIMSEDGKSEVFKVIVKEGAQGAISKAGVVFGKGSPADGKASITVVESLPAEGLKDYLADKYGKALVNLKAIEEAIPSALSCIDRMREDIKADIVIG